MPASSIILVCVAVAAFIALGLAGRARPNAALWKWIDPIYYALGAIGVILLFLSEDRNAALARAQQAQVRLETDWRSHPNIRPEVSLEATPPELVRAYYSGLMASVDLGEACRQSYTMDCASHVENADMITEAFKGFDPALETNDDFSKARLEEDFCSRASILVQKLADESSIDADAFQDLKIALSRRAKSDVSLAFPTDEEITAFSTVLKRQRENYLKLTKGSSAEDFGITQSKQQVDFALYLFKMTAFCASRPDDLGVNVRRMINWSGEEAKRAVTRATLAADLDRAKRSHLPTPWQLIMRFVRDSFWPFVLVVALSLKFGKAMAALGHNSRIRRA